MFVNDRALGGCPPSDPPRTRRKSDRTIPLALLVLAITVRSSGTVTLFR